MSTSSQFSIKPQVVDLVSTNYRRISTPLPCPGSEEVITKLAETESRSMHGQIP